MSVFVGCVSVSVSDLEGSVFLKAVISLFLFLCNSRDGHILVWVLASRSICSVTHLQPSIFVFCCAQLTVYFRCCLFVRGSCFMSSYFTIDSVPIPGSLNNCLVFLRAR